MTYDLRVPLALKKEQQWFGSIIGRPIDDNNQMMTLSPSGLPMEVEASRHIIPSPTLRPEQRIQIYNQQYWWRLLRVLKESFPILTRFFGNRNFDRLIAIPYLVKYPPHHWSLGPLGDRLVQWIVEEYEESNQQLIVDAAKLDWAFVSSFTVEQWPEMPRGVGEELTTRTLYCQPHLHLFQFGADLIHYRQALMEHDPEYWESNPLPDLVCDKHYYFVVYRNPRLDISWKEIGPIEHALLLKFQQGASIEQVCEWIEMESIDVYHEAADHLQKWFEEWTARSWLTPGR